MYVSQPRPNGRDRLLRLCAGSALASALVAVGSPAGAAEAAAAAAAPAPAEQQADYGTRVEELTVTGTAPVETVAPAKASLATIEPQSIVSREALDQLVAQTGDFTQAIAFTPSISGTSPNGPGLSESKITLRGFADSQYNVTYDGIPFGDTNNPTHHSTSFFPAGNIGAVVVDRGPGQAGQMGQATFGGSINLFSPQVGDEFGGYGQLTAGTWNTYLGLAQLNTGAIDALAGTKALLSVSVLRTDGYLSDGKDQGNNFMFRTVTPLGGDWKLTLFDSYNYTFTNLSDVAGDTLAQVAQFGKNYALNDDPRSSNFADYNTQKKHSNFGYARAAGDATSSTHIEDTAYSYYYSNHTISAQDVTGFRAVETTIPKGDVPGYTKDSYYHVYGDILRVTQDLPFGDVKAGLWWETSKTKRNKYDVDLTTGLPDPLEVCPKLLPGVICNRLPGSNVNYVQQTGWDQYQPFVDVDWKVFDGLTLSPGIKYVHFKRTIDTPVNQGSGTQLDTSATWTKTLYFFTANYRLKDNWSAYAQYATGIYVPDLNSLQAQIPLTSQEQPQLSTNYQVGTVYNGRILTIDADVYQIDFKNKFQSVTVPVGQPQAGETLFYNLGGAKYRGVEGEATVQVAPGAFLFLSGSLNSAKAQGGSTTIAGVPVTITGGKQIAGAPRWTAAEGFIWKTGDWIVSATDKWTGEQWAAEGEPSNFRLKPYDEVDLTVVRTFGKLRLEGALYNLTDSKSPILVRPAGKVANTPTPADQYFFQAGRSVQVTARYNF